MLRISSASSWFFFTRLYREARLTKHKIWEVFIFVLTFPDEVRFYTKITEIYITEGPLFEHSSLCERQKPTEQRYIIIFLRMLCVCLFPYTVVCPRHSRTLSESSKG